MISILYSFTNGGQDFIEKIELKINFKNARNIEGLFEKYWYPNTLTLAPKRFHGSQNKNIIQFTGKSLRKALFLVTANLGAVALLNRSV